MFNILSHHGNENQNIPEIHLTPVRMAKIKKKPKNQKTNNNNNNNTPQVTADAGDYMIKEKHSPIVGVIASWYKHPGNQSGGSSENWT